MAIRDDLVRIADERSHSIGIVRDSRRSEEILHVDVPGARDVPLPRIAWIPLLPCVLRVGPHIEDRQALVLQARGELFTRRERG